MDQNGVINGGTAPVFGGAPIQTPPTSTPVGAPVVPPVGAPAGAPISAPAPAPAPKKSNAGIIIAIIVAALILAGGAVAAVLILNNNGDKKTDDTSKQANNDSDKKDDNTDDKKSDSDKKSSGSETAYSYTSNSAYFIKIDGKKYDFNNTITEVEKSGFKMHSEVKDQNVPAHGYAILIGGSKLTNTDGYGFEYTPYNDGSEKTTVAKSKLGSITISEGYSDAQKAVSAKFSVNGGIHIGSTLEELKKVFGEPTSTYDSTYVDTTTYRYEASTYKKYTFTIKDGAVSEISWTNYGSLVR